MAGGAHVSPDDPGPLRRLAITWSIPDDFGGMTSAMLHRSRALAAATGEPVDVLTFDPRTDYDLIRAKLTASGELDGVRLRNLYEDLATSDGAGPVAEIRKIHDDDGELARVEHRRADGSLAVLDERSVATGFARRISVYSADETPLAAWTGAWSCYATWVDRLLAGAPAVAVVDSKTMAPFLARLHRPNLATIHVVHASHLAGSHRPYAPLRPSRASALAHPDRFHAIVFLTERQRKDAIELLDDPGNLVVIGNGRPLPELVRPEPRSGGVVVAGLTGRKRVDHAVEIAAKAGHPLTVVGDGAERARLEQVAAQAGGDIVFDGHRPDGAEAFAEASWMLLTSRSEGSPLVLAEAMARGCVPIAYDVPYGPADLIDDGVNGFLVPDGDREAAVAAIRRLDRMTAGERTAMREAARRTAEQFDDRTVTDAWLELEREAFARSTSPEPEVHARVERVRLRLRRGRLRLSARVLDLAPDARVTASFRLVGTTRVVRRRVAISRGGRVHLTLRPEPTALLTPRRGALDVRFEVRIGGTLLELPKTRRHPDRRSLPRRVVGRLRRLAGRLRRRFR